MNDTSAKGSASGSGLARKQGLLLCPTNPW